MNYEEGGARCICYRSTSTLKWSHWDAVHDAVSKPTDALRFDFDNTQAAMKGVDDLDASEDVWVGQWEPGSLKPADVTPAGEELKPSSRSMRAAATASGGLPQVVIKATADGRIIDPAYTSSTSNSTDPGSGRTRFQWSVRTSSVELGWWTPSDDVEWTIKRDGQVIAHTEGTEYTDTAADLRQGSTYSVTGAHKYTDEDRKEQESKFVYGTSAPPAPADVRGLKTGDPKIHEVAAYTDIAELSTFMWGPTGFHTLVGKHDGAPNYEYKFTYQKGQSAQTIGCSYRFKRGLFEELLPPMDVDVDVSWTPNGAWKKVCPTFIEGWE